MITKIYRVSLLTAIFMVHAYVGFSQNSTQALKWEIAYHNKEKDSPKTWMPAVVPGAVQLDVMKAQNYKQPYWYRDNFKQFNWMEDQYFTYRTRFDKPAFKNRQRLYFHSKGIDYNYKIYLNNVPVYKHEGMFTYVDLDITDQLKAHNELTITLMPVPRLKDTTVFVPGTDTYRNNARESVKPAVSYGWDWHPRLVTRGIWDETYLEIKNKAHLTETNVSYTLNDELSRANINLSVRGEGLLGAHYRWILKDQKGQLVFHKDGVFNNNVKEILAVIDRPELWWPHDYGKPVLYSSEIIVEDAQNVLQDSHHQKIGFRRVKMVMNEGEWEKPIIFPMSRNRAPACIEVNNRRIFAKGTNWVHPEIFVGLITKQTYDTQLQLAKDANFNILRVWGGGIINKESFFDLCDEKGLLVWQEFPLACNNYPDDSLYLSTLEKEATSIINRVKQHACLALWSGGNELFNDWSRMTDQSLALRLLNSLCYRLDPQTPFIPTAPLNGMGHGSYLFYDKATGEEVFQWMARADNTAYSEFGVPGVANLEVLKQFMSPDELFPPKKGTSWQTHHAFGVWHEDSWLELPFLELYFGKMNSIENLVKYSQISQSEGYKFIFEEARRQRPYCGMALNWCFQEPWPSAANNSLINWPNVIKPAYYAVAKACRPVLASMRASKFKWTDNEEFTGQLFMLNDTYDALTAQNIKVTLLYDDKKIALATWDFTGAGKFENGKGPIVKVKLPKMKNNLFKVMIEVEGQPQYNSEYTFLYKAGA